MPRDASDYMRWPAVTGRCDRDYLTSIDEMDASGLPRLADVAT
jgi:hypothetical protein